MHAFRYRPQSTRCLRGNRLGPLVSRAYARVLVQKFRLDVSQPRDGARAPLSFPTMRCPVAGHPSGRNRRQRVAAGGSSAKGRSARPGWPRWTLPCKSPERPELFHDSFCDRLWSTAQRGREN